VNDGDWVGAGRRDRARQCHSADDVSAALMAALDTLTAEERLVYVLADAFGLPSGEIASIVGCTRHAACELATRARARVRFAAPKLTVSRGE
jgi:RNA polymerase sigma-70 factor, ECF subfamily